MSPRLVAAIVALGVASGLFGIAVVASWLYHTHGAAWTFAFVVSTGIGVVVYGYMREGQGYR